MDKVWPPRWEQIRRELGGEFPSKQTVLYVGANPGRFQMGRELFEAGCEVTLLEAHKPFADHYEGHQWLKEVIHGDVRDIKNIAGGRVWDTIVWWHGPEHVRQEELEATLTDIESVTSRLVILGCPWGENIQGPVSKNPFAVHQNHLDTDDLSSLGYATRTLGARNKPDTWCHILAWKSLVATLTVVYTAIFGGYDDLHPVPTSEIPYVHFTDEPIDVSGWNTRVFKGQFRDNRRDARMRKLLAHQWLPDADISIWQDGCVELVPEKIAELVSYLADNDFAMFAHPWRDCVYGEAEAVINQGKAPAPLVQAQISRYRRAGYPEHNGLVQTTVMVRRHTAAAARLNDAWWSELTRFTNRDQLSFNYACWKNEMRYSVIPSDVWDDFCAWRGHRG